MNTRHLRILERIASDHGIADGPKFTLVERASKISGIRLYGNSQDFKDAALYWGLALLIAYKLGCVVENQALGQVSCAPNWHWLITITPNFDRCDYMDCLHDFGKACHLVETEHPDLHGCEDHGACKTLPWLVTTWAAEHVEWLAQVTDRAGTPAGRRLDSMTAGLPRPEPYDFLNNYWHDINYIASLLD